MKKFYTIVLLPLCAAPAFAAWDGTASSWTMGDGSEANPYLIENEQQLAYFQQQVTAGEAYEGKYFQLTADLDMGADQGLKFSPIGFHDDYMAEDVAYQESKAFLGTFDGNYKTIDNIYVRMAQADTDEIGGVGLFAVGREQTVVKNVVLGSRAIVDGDSMKGDNSRTADIGGIMGISYGSQIYNCMNNGTIAGGSVETGGIVGFAQSGSVIDGCINNASMTGFSFSGGIAGASDKATISNCYSTGAINGGQAYWIAGIIGWANAQSKLTNCYSISKMTGISGSSYLPGISPIVAELERSTASKCYYVQALTGCKPLSSQSGVTAVSEDEMKSASILSALNDDNAEGSWMAGANGYPTLRWTSMISAGVDNIMADNVLPVEFTAAGGVITVTTAASQAVFTVCDMTGRTLHSAPVAGESASFTPSAGGIYVAIVTSPEGKAVCKITL